MQKETQQILAKVVGAVLTLVGLAGFFTEGTLLVFGVNGLHNLIHLVSGVLGLLAGFYEAGKSAGYYNRVLGVVYIVVALLGFIVPDAMAYLLAVNMPDNILHLVLGIVLAGVGYGAK